MSDSSQYLSGLYPTPESWQVILNTYLLCLLPSSFKISKKAIESFKEVAILVGHHNYRLFVQYSQILIYQLSTEPDECELWGLKMDQDTGVVRILPHFSRSAHRAFKRLINEIKLPCQNGDLALEYSGVYWKFLNKKIQSTPWDCHFVRQIVYHEIHFPLGSTRELPQFV